MCLGAFGGGVMGVKACTVCGKPTPYTDWTTCEEHNPWREALACQPSKHKAMKESPELMGRLAVFIGVQHDAGFADLALHNCRKCGSTISVRVAEKTAA